MPDQLSSVPTMTGTETQTLPASVPKTPALSLSHPLCSAPSPTSPWHLLIHPHSQLPAASYDLSQCPSTQPEEQTPQVVPLADSNGKFLEANKLLLGKKVLSKCCSTTGKQ